MVDHDPSQIDEGQPGRWFGIRFGLTTSCREVGDLAGGVPLDGTLTLEHLHHLAEERQTREGIRIVVGSTERKWRLAGHESSLRRTGWLRLDD